jgi:hypothetical protein
VRKTGTTESFIIGEVEGDSSSAPTPARADSTATFAPVPPAPTPTPALLVDEVDDQQPLGLNQWGELDDDLDIEEID